MGVKVDPRVILVGSDDGTVAVLGLRNTIAGLIHTHLTLLGQGTSGEIAIEVRYTLRGNPGVHKRTARSATLPKLRAVQSGTVLSSGPSYSLQRYQLMSCCCMR
jgi:hypothetical protein